MQQLRQRNTYTPTNTSLVCSNCDSELNKDVNLSVQNSKTCLNISEENQRQHTDGSDLRVLNIVYVLNQRGKPLMPTKSSKARKLLKQGNARVVRNTPFTIQLLYATGESKQAITLGVDTGYQYIGLSAVTKKQELFAAIIKLRTDIVKLLLARRSYRRNRRQRKTWYRQSRFLNRKKNKGWLAPSIQHRLDSHLRIINFVKRLLPISEIVIEVAAFDIQKIKNPSIEGKDYQNGEQKDFWNVREYVLYRDKHTCQYCHVKDTILEVHHIISRSTGGSNSPDNLITLCIKCHQKITQNKLKLTIRLSDAFKTETFMSIIRWKIVDRLRKLGNVVRCTYGYVTKSKLINLHLAKSHINDAFVIAEGNLLKERCVSYIVIQKRRNNRKLQQCRKGYKPAIRRCRYSIQPKDIVVINKQLYISMGTSNFGQQITVRDTTGERNYSVKKIEKHYYINGWLFLSICKYKELGYAVVH